MSHPICSGDYIVVEAWYDGAGKAHVCFSKAYQEVSGLIIDGQGAGIDKADQEHLAGDEVKLILIREELTDYGLILLSVEEHAVRVTAETEVIDEKHIFILHQGSGHGEILRGNLQEVNVVEILAREEIRGRTLVEKALAGELVLGAAESPLSTAPLLSIVFFYF